MNYVLSEVKKFYKQCGGCSLCNLLSAINNLLSGKIASMNKLGNPGRP